MYDIRPSIQPFARVSSVRHDFIHAPHGWFSRAHCHVTVERFLAHTQESRHRWESLGAASRPGCEVILCFGASGIPPFTASSSASVEVNGEARKKREKEKRFSLTDEIGDTLHERSNTEHEEVTVRSVNQIHLVSNQDDGSLTIFLNYR